MSIRFKCTACQTVLKIAERIHEQKKVRCTECGLVILLTPDDDGPDGMRVSVPEKPTRMGLTDRDLAFRRNLLIGILAILVIGVGIGIYYTTRGPAGRAAIEGNVTLDEGPIEKGFISFTPVDGAQGSVAMAHIVRGRYSLSATDGPTIGTNRVDIRTDKDGAVAKRYNVESKEKIEIKAGQNKQDFDVKSK